MHTAVTCQDGISRKAATCILRVSFVFSNPASAKAN